MGFAIVAIIGGLLILLGLYLWANQREKLGYLAEAGGEFDNIPYAGGDGDSDVAVLVSTEHGQLIHANAKAREWLDASGSIPDLEYVASLTQPSESFIRLFTGEAQASFQIVNKWVFASSHVIPTESGQRTAIVMRELSGVGGAQESLNLSQSMSLINRIGELVNASMGMEQVLQILLELIMEPIEADAGEICIWDEGRQILHQRGWTGDTRYLLVMAELGGTYELGQGTAGWVAKHRRPVLIAGRNDPNRISGGADKNPYESVLSVPLTLGEQFIGTVTLFSDTVSNFNQKHLALLQSVSKSVALAIYNAELYTRQIQRIDDIAGLQELAEKAEAMHEADRVYKLLNRRISELVDAEMSGIFIYDENRQGLVPQPPFHGLPDNVVQLIFLPLIPDTEPRAIWENQQYWISNDVVDEPLVEQLSLTPIVEVAGIRNTALIPMQVGGARIGLLAVSNKRAEGGFGPRDIQNLRVLSAQATIVVENMRLYEREKRIGTELVGLQEMTHAIGALSHGGEFYSEIVERIARLMECEMCGILLYDETEKALKSQLPFYGVENDLIRDYSIDLSPGTVMEELWSEEQTWYTNRVSVESLVFEAGLEVLAEKIGVTKTLFAVMNVAGRRMGVVQVSNRLNDHDFTDSDARLLRIFATQAAAIVENARLVREVQRSARQAEDLRRVAEMAGKVLTSEQTFKPVLEEISAIMLSPLVYVNTIDHVTGNLITYPDRVYGMELSEPIRQDLGSAGFKYSVAVAGRSFISNDINKDTRVLDSYRQIASAFGITKSILVPLSVGERNIGELGIANRKDEPYTEEDLEALRTIAAQIAAALERLLLYEATGENLRRRVEELDAISRVSNELTLTVDLDAVLDIIRHEASQAANSDGSTIALLKPQAAWANPDEPELDRRIGAAEIMRSLADIELESIARGASPLVIADYATTTLAPLPAQTRSAVAVPIYYLDDVVGVIHVYHNTPNRFDDRVATFLLTLSTKAALGYQNAARYREQIDRSDRLRRRVDQLNRIFELGQMLQHTSDAVSVLEAIAYSIQQSVGYDTVLMLLYNDKSMLFERVAQAGMPIKQYEESRSLTISMEVLQSVLNDEFRLSDSYFFPFESVSKWFVPGMEALSTSFDANRSLPSGTQDGWHDGDLFLVRIRGSSGNIIGLICVDRPHDNLRPDQNSAEMLEIFAHQASTTLENMRLFSESLRNAEEEAQINEMTEEVASTLDLDKIAETVATGILKLVRFSQMTVVARDVHQEGFDVIRATVTDGEVNVTQDHRPTLERTALGRTFTEHKSYLYSADSAENEDYDDLRSWHSKGEKTSLMIPLLTGGECVGTIHLGSNRAAHAEFTTHRQLLLRVAQLLGGAVQNARLFRQAVELQALNRSVVESIQQGIVVLDNSGRIVTVNDYMRSRYGWDDSGLRKDLFAYRPEMADILKTDIQVVLMSGVPRENLGQVTPDESGAQLVRNFYLYPLRSGESISGAVLLVEDVTERTRLEQAIESRANQLAALTEVSTHISATLDREEVLGLALQEMGWIIPFDVMSIWRRVDDRMVLEGVQFSEDAEREPVEETTIAYTDHPQFRVIVESQRVSVDSVEEPLDGYGVPGEANARSWMGIPLVSQGEVIGLIVMTKNEANFYDTRSEQHVAQAFAGQLAIALANAGLFEQMFDRTNELETLLEASTATSMTLDMNNVFKTVVELMFKTLEMEHCAIMIYRDIDNELEVQVDIDREGDTEHLMARGTILPLQQYPGKARALRDREVVVIADSPDHPSGDVFAQELDQMRERGYGVRMLVPLVVSDLSRGLILLEQRAQYSESLTQQRVRLARALGTQVAIAIENARLSTETNARFEELWTINSLSRAITSTLNVEDMISVMRDHFPSITDASEMYLAIYHPETELIEFPLAMKGNEQFEIPSRNLGTDEVSYVIKKRRSLNLGADYFPLEELRRSMGITSGEGDIKSYMGVPLIAGDQVLGVLAIRDSERTRAFDVNNEQILTTIGSQLAAGIQNARLFNQISDFAQNLNLLVEEQTEELEQERDRLDTLYRITSELSRTLDMDMLSERALGMVSRAVGAEDGVILLSDPITDKLYPRAALDPEFAPAREGEDHPHHPAEALASWLIMQDEQDNVLLVDDLHAVDYWDKTRAGAEQWRSALAVLLEMNEDPMGVMVFLSSRKGAFTELQLKLGVAAATQVAASINNADLYQLIRDQAERLGTLLRAEQEEAERSNSILEGIADGVLLADNNGLITLFNSAAERILGLPRDQVLSQPLGKLTGLYGASASEWDKVMREWSESPHPEKAGEYMDQKLELGERVVSVHHSPVYNGDEFLGIVSVFRDVTMDVEVDRMKSEFITSVSHEFRTPLTPIKGYTDLLKMGAAGILNDKQSVMVDSIKNNVDRLSRLVNDVLDIARLDAGDVVMSMGMVDLSEIVAEVMTRHASRPTNVAKNIESIVQTDDDVPAIRGDKEKITQIVSNLVDNAFNYTNEGGKVSVSVSVQPNNYALIKVSDTGVGIPREFYDSVWMRFERYEEHALQMDVAGTGLGLPLVKELVTRHHGQVWFESEQGKGTTFFVELPIDQPKYTTKTVDMPQISAKTAGD